MRFFIVNLTAFMILSLIACKERQESSAIVSEKISSGALTEAEKALLAKNGWNEDGVRIYPGYNVFPYMDTNLGLLLEKQGINVREKMCVQMVQKIGFPENYMFFQFLKTQCPKKSTLFRSSEVVFELVSVPLDITKIAKQKAPVFGYIVGFTPLENSVSGALVDLRRPEYVIGFWFDDIDNNKKGQLKDTIIVGFCNKMTVSMINSDFDFSKTCTPKVDGDNVLVGVNYKKPFVEPARVAEIQSQTRDEDGSNFTNSYQASSYQQPPPQQTEDQDDRHVPLWFDRQQLKESRESAQNLFAGRGSIFSRMGDIKRLEQSNALLRGDTEAAFRAGSEAAIYKGDLKEYMRYQRVQAVHQLMGQLLNGR